MFVLIFVFLAALAGIVGLFFLFENTMRKSDVDAIKSRLMGNAKPKKAKAGATPALINTEDKKTGELALGLLRRFQLRDRLQQLLDRAGLRWNAGRFAHSILLGVLLGFVSVWYLAPPPFNRIAFLAGPVGGLAPILYVQRIGKKRLHKFEEQFPDSLEFLGRSMRAGHAFSVALEMLHREFEEPLSGEFRRAFDEQNLGLPLEVALEKLSKRVPLLDVQFFTSAVLLQKRTGGNLAELLDKLAYLIRERFKLRGRIRAVSAHGKMTGSVLSAIPAGVGAIMFYVNPDYAMFFFNDPTGQIMLGGAVVLQFIGYGIIRKIVSIEV